MSDNELQAKLSIQLGQALAGLKTLGGELRTVAEPWLKLRDQPKGKHVCIEVRVHRASGADAARTFEKGCVA